MMDIAKLLNGVSEAILKERHAREEAAALARELQRSRTQLQEAEKCIAVYNKKLQDLVHNYAALAPVIGKKNQLAKEVTSLHEKLQQIEKEHTEEVEKLKSQTEEAAKEGQEVAKALRVEAAEKAREVAEKHQAALKELEDLLQKEKLDKKTEAEQHSTAFEEMRRKHHQEMESLRGRLQLLQQNMSSRATSNMDLFANKLQATRAEFEDQLSERDSRIAKLEEELACARESLRHQQLLTVMRGVVTTSAATPTSSPRRRPESRQAQPGSPKENAGDFNADGENDPGTSSSSSSVPLVQEGDDPPRGPASVAQGSRQDKKRKLYSGESLLQEPSM
ncbi:golgin subfamily A member 4-like [Penaeus chinensis]|uniref:golgin subfamily A member 4-like n=1 Tax=Penaeus chinensis TaxID=139456 RepID=UPI001FB71C60|nr:golgin subfamily A member 4-like [Penaeus chinensis]